MNSAMMTDYRLEISQDGETFKKLKEGADFKDDVATHLFQNGQRSMG